MQVKPHFAGHIAEECLEEYAFGRIADPEAAEVEEHLLLCEACREDLGQVEHYIRLMKAATCDPMVPRPRRITRRITRRWIGYVAGGAIAAGLGVAALIPSRAPQFETVDLAAMRGAEMARMHAGRAADLRIDTAGLADGVYRVDLVDSAGRVAWSGTGEAVREQIGVREPKPLRAGVYWVRLYSGNGVLVREFGIENVR